MTATLQAIKDCINFLSHNEQDVLPEVKIWYQQTISDLKGYLTDTEDILEYQYSDSEYFTDCHPEYAECF